MRIKLTKEMIEINEFFDSFAHDLFFIGGCVRDLILGKEPHDYDLSTPATPNQIESELDKQRASMSFKAFFRLLSTPQILDDAPSDGKIDWDDDKKEIARNFNEYAGAAKRILGNRYNLLKETLVSKRNYALPCDICNTIGRLLRNEGFSPNEWQDYLESSTTTT